MEPNGKPPGEREITYRAGWKKGKIRPRPSKVEAKADKTRRGLIAVDELRELTRRYMWKETPLPSAGIWSVILAAFPVVCFAAALWLTVTLIHLAQ